MTPAYKRAVATGLALACVSVSCAALAQSETWPRKPIRLILPFPPGGGTDAMARIITTKLTEVLDAWGFEPLAVFAGAVPRLPLLPTAHGFVARREGVRVLSGPRAFGAGRAAMIEGPSREAIELVEERR